MTELEMKIETEAEDLDGELSDESLDRAEAYACGGSLGCYGG